MAHAGIEIVIGSAATMDALKLQARANYIKSLKQDILATTDNVANFTTTVKQIAANTSEVYSLSTVLYGVKADNTRVNPPNFKMTSDGTYAYLATSYNTSQLTNAYGCQDLPTNPTYIGKLCEFSLDYVGTESQQVLATVEFSLAIKIPKSASSTYSVNAAKIYKNLCDCSIVTAYPLVVEAFSDTGCSKPFTGTSITYGSTICLKLTSTNTLANSYTFSPSSVLMTYRTTGGSPISVEMIPVTSISKGKGYAFVSLDVLTTGNQVLFTTTLVLEGGRRMLEEGRLLQAVAEGNGLQGNTTEYTVIANETAEGSSTGSSTGTSTTNTTTNVISSAGTLIVSLVGLFTAIIALL